MNEDKVKKLTQKWLEEQGFKVKEEIGVSGTNREVILDFYAYSDNSPPPHQFSPGSVNSSQVSSTHSFPIIVWVEAKGDENLSTLLEGFIRLELAIYLGGGLGILAIPNEATKKLLKYRGFLKQAEGVIKLFDAEKKELHQL